MLHITGTGGRARMEPGTAASKLPLWSKREMRMNLTRGVEEVSDSVTHPEIITHKVS